MKDIVAFWGYPPPEILQAQIQKYPNAEIIDLDIDFGYPSSGVACEAYCKIITNIINNAIYLKDQIKVIIATTGKEKCDAGYFAAVILEEMGLNVIKTRYEVYPAKPFQTPICESNLPLKEKINLITEGIYKKQSLNLTKSTPTIGFWGVPPNDFELLELFPDTTHVFGWVRCVEAGRPGDLELEMLANPDIPTVFFTQTFCAKMQIAKHLANKYNGLFIDADDRISRSTKAKVEAFIKLR